MKFSHYLHEHLFQPWKNEYIQYSQLKAYIKERTQHTYWTSEDEFNFTNMIRTEFTKVNRFIKVETNRIIKRKQESVETIYTLIDFVKLNSIGFQKILKKHDRYTHASLTDQFQSIQDKFRIHINYLEKQINILVKHQQSHNDNEILYNKKIESSSSSSTTTTKYWVHLDHLNELEAVLSFHLTKDKNIVQTIYYDNLDNFCCFNNLLKRNEAAEIIRARWYNMDETNIFFERKRYYQNLSHNNETFKKESFNIHSNDVKTYLSNGTFYGQKKILAASMYEAICKDKIMPVIRSYHHRTVYRLEKLNNFQISFDTDLTFMKELTTDWKGNIENSQQLNPDETYTFPYAILEISSLEDVPLPKWLTQLLKSQLVFEVPYFIKYLHGVSFLFRDRLPKLPWWISEMNADIRLKISNREPCMITVDDDSAEKNEKISSFYPLNDQPNFSAINVTSSSYVGLMAIQDHNRAISSCQPKNKFISTITLLNTNIVKRINQFKHEFYLDHSQPREENYISMMGWLWARIRLDKTIFMEEDGDGNHKKEKKIEPKIFFANERTFISWLQFSALLLAVSIGLINFGDHISKGSGAFLIVVAMTLAMYAQLRFQYRSWQIRFRGELRFDDMYGPAILCFVLIIALFINLGLRLSQPIPTDPSLFSYNTTATTNFTTTNLIGKNTLEEEEEKGNNHKVHIQQQTFSNGTRIDKHGHLVPIDDEP
ncbi:VTC domain-containing protein [Cokeromyces recurvatus]|uniref:VTC domain-containing protein n=1 Tax=Cokeromyces recurvatus TaxID=90255 RepID=UPI00221E5B9A|nr:VTC domain-containing protein [Cokeromyces recurvatus]KAI7904519.1 VTC domain-containing protein [Cokeromyces recurvatus]